MEEPNINGSSITTFHDTNDPFTSHDSQANNHKTNHADNNDITVDIPKNLPSNTVAHARSFSMAQPTTIQMSSSSHHTNPSSPTQQQQQQQQQQYRAVQTQTQIQSQSQSQPQSQTHRQPFQPQPHHRHSSSLGQMATIVAQQHHHPRNHYAALRMGLGGDSLEGQAFTSAPGFSGHVRSATTGPNRIPNTGATPNLANLAIYTTQNGSAFVRSLSQQQHQQSHQQQHQMQPMSQQHLSAHHLGSVSPSNSSIASGTSWASPSTHPGTAPSLTGSSFSPLTSTDSRFSGTAPSMDSRDTSMDGYSNSATSISRASPASQQDHSMVASTSNSSSGSNFNGGIGLNITTRQKHKSKLLNIDRKRICLQHLRNPKLKQEDLAQIFGIERSTVSKVLKEQERWLSIADDSDDAAIVKHRNPRFPELEEQLATWAREAQAAGEILTDANIRKKALEIAQHLEPDSQNKKFKASGGWVEKFRNRAGLRKTNDSSPLSTQVRRHNTCMSLGASVESMESGPSLATGSPQSTNSMGDVSKHLSSAASSQSVGSISSVPMVTGHSRVSSLSHGYSNSDLEDGRRDAGQYAPTSPTKGGTRQGSSTPVRGPIALDPQRDDPFSTSIDANLHGTKGAAIHGASDTPSSKQKRHFDAMAGVSHADVGRAGHQSTPVHGRRANSHVTQSGPLNYYVNEFGAVVSPVDSAASFSSDVGAQPGSAKGPSYLAPAHGQHQGYSSDSKRRRGATTTGVSTHHQHEIPGQGPPLGSPFAEGNSHQAQSMPSRGAYNNGFASQVDGGNHTHDHHLHDPFYTPSHRPGELQNGGMNMMPSAEMQMQLAQLHHGEEPSPMLDLANLEPSSTHWVPNSMGVQTRATVGNGAQSHHHSDVFNAPDNNGNAIGLQGAAASQDSVASEQSPVSPLRPLRLSDLGRSNTSPNLTSQQANHQNRQEIVPRRLLTNDVERVLSRRGVDPAAGGLMTKFTGGKQLMTTTTTHGDGGNHVMQHSLSEAGLMDMIDENAAMQRQDPDLGQRRGTRHARQAVKHGRGDLPRARSDISSRSGPTSLRLTSVSPRSSLGTLTNRGSSRARTISSSSSTVGTSSGSGAVSLDQARESLDIVLQFLNESEEADLIPRSHFLTLGSLHGSLSAAAAAAFQGRRRREANTKSSMRPGSEDRTGSGYEQEMSGAMSDENSSDDRRGSRDAIEQRDKEAASAAQRHLSDAGSKAGATAVTTCATAAAVSGD
ncbi:unnamed protein product [Sympodiomycopsis kandeliae]